MNRRSNIDGNVSVNAFFFEAKNSTQYYSAKLVKFDFINYCDLHKRPHSEYFGSIQPVIRANCFVHIICVNLYHNIVVKQLLANERQSRWGDIIWDIRQMNYFYVKFTILIKTAVFPAFN